MPTSVITGKAVSAMVMADLHREAPIPYILDVGPGMGVYRRLMAPVLPGTRWIALEIWAPYVLNHGLRELYDAVHIADFTCFDFGCAPSGGMAILGDVLEHIDQAQALLTISRMMERVEYALLSIPVGVWPQETVYGNPWEAHVHTWRAEDIWKSFSRWLAGTIILPVAPRQDLATVFLARTEAGRERLMRHIARAQSVYRANEKQLAYCGLDWCPDYTLPATIEQFHTAMKGHLSPEAMPAA